MGLARSTFYDRPCRAADADEIVARMQMICDEFEATATGVSAPRFAIMASW